MKSESNIKPALIERYDNFLRVNYGVSEEKHKNGEEEATSYVFNMIEMSQLPDFDSLVSLLVNDRYSLQDQTDILSGDDSAEISKLNLWRLYCKRVARELLGIPETLVTEKEYKIAEITAYDQSDAVNQFSIQGMSLWLDSVTRPKLMRRFEAEKATGQTETTLWWGTIKLEMSVDTAINMLNAIEMYACQCFDVTASHKAAVMKLDSVDDVVSYDFTTGYPEKLSL